MKKKYLYFQPEYVGKFKCDGSKCNARCCKNWSIFIDKKSYQKYPPEVTAHMKFNSERDKYLMIMTGKNFCPLLTEDNLCCLQRDYGEDFLSQTCATYPRLTFDFGNFFERSLTLTCPLAAELVLFQEEPMQFEYVEVPEKIHSNGGKIQFGAVQTLDGFAELMLEIQIAQISILQERTLSIDQRLIMLGFFLDKLDELKSKEVFTEAEAVNLIRDLKNLIAVYESKMFLHEQVPRMIQIVAFDVRKFIGLMLNLLESFYGDRGVKLTKEDGKILDAVVETLEIKPDESNCVSLSKIAAKYERLAVARKKFFEKYSAFLENYLVNELFINVYPWRLKESLAKNYAVFVTSYKIFELIFFSATRGGFESKTDLLKIVDLFERQFYHTSFFTDKILAHFKDIEDVFPIMESLLEK